MATPAGRKDGREKLSGAPGLHGQGWAGSGSQQQREHSGHYCSEGTEERAALGRWNC